MVQGFHRCGYEGPKAAIPLDNGDFSMPTHITYRSSLTTSHHPHQRSFSPYRPDTFHDNISQRPTTACTTATSSLRSTTMAVVQPVGILVAMGISSLLAPIMIGATQPPLWADRETGMGVQGVGGGVRFPAVHLIHQPGAW
ncbi:hypothetical protein BD410DRAFT_282632 [Rickenella mellea]|uniref:Uncharacterized protein n=1 Tax=Rickenella mellea TaxID=50990 RepID=A0A4Y7Q2K6_9AGAM|nr:hypothetical protein BD410DRAFT_282632 [Rickenella mellea]